MSANDIIYINKETFTVYHCDVEHSITQNDIIGKGKDWKDALRIADEYQEEGMYPVEYGIKFI